MSNAKLDKVVMAAIEWREVLALTAAAPASDGARAAKMDADLELLRAVEEFLKTGNLQRRAG